jgi:hypothetical protein
MHSRKAVCTTGRWRLSVHNTTSTSDIEQTTHIAQDVRLRPQQPSQHSACTSSDRSINQLTHNPFIFSSDSTLAAMVTTTIEAELYCKLALLAVRL